MAIRPCADLSSSGWISDSELPWQRLVSMGPSGFAAYARLRFIPDPLHPGQSENEVEVGPDGPSEHQRLLAALEVLGRHTSTPDDVCYGIWDGWGWSPQGYDEGDPPALRMPYRSYHLLQGALADFGSWHLPDPAFVWPADHAWCLADDVDPHYAGIGASEAAIAELLERPGLDVVRADPSVEQPAYR